jgi:hypothetical protein
MIFALIGIVVTGAGASALWYFLPTNGTVHPLARAPFLDSLIPIGILSALAIGIAMFVSAFL